MLLDDIREVSDLDETSLLRLQRVEVLSQIALTPAQGLVVHFQLPGVRRQLRHFFGQIDEKRPVLSLHRLQVRVVVGQRVEQRRLHALQPQEVAVVVGAVGVDEDVDAGAVAALHRYEGVGLILIGGDVGQAVGHGRGLVVVHEEDGAGDCDGQQHGHEEQDGAEQVAAAHPLRHREGGTGQRGERVLVSITVGARANIIA